MVNAARQGRHRAFRSEAYHQLQHDLVLFRFLGLAVTGVEILLEIQPEVGDGCFAEAEGDAAGQAMPFVVGGGQGAGRFVGGFSVALAGHHVVACEERDLPEHSPQGEVVAHEAVQGMHVVVGTIGIGLIQILPFDVHAAGAVEGADVVGVYPHVLRLEAL